MDFSYLPEGDLRDDTIKHLRSLIPWPLHYVTEENKFSNDLLPTKALAEIYPRDTEDCVAAGCPEGLW